MRELTEKQLSFISGADGKNIVVWGAGALTLAVTKHLQASLAAGLLARQIYEGGYTTAPKITQGLGS